MSWQYSWGHLIRNDLKRSRNLLYSYNINSELKIDNINCIQRPDEKVQYGATNAKNLNYNQGGILWPWVLKTVWSTKVDRSRVYIRPKTLNSEAFFFLFWGIFAAAPTTTTSKFRLRQKNWENSEKSKTLFRISIMWNFWRSLWNTNRNNKFLSATEFWPGAETWILNLWIYGEA